MTNPFYKGRIESSFLKGRKYDPLGGQVAESARRRISWNFEFSLFGFVCFEFRASDLEFPPALRRQGAA